MGAYGFHVWGSMACALAVFVWNVIAPRLRRAQVLRLLADDENQDIERG